MVWYTASVVLAIKIENEAENTIPVFENFYLIEADSRQAALAKAESIGRDEAKANQDITYLDKPACYIFAGVRKIRSIYNPSPLDVDNDPPISGTELSHSYFELDNQEDLENFAKGQTILAKYIDDDSE